MTNKYILAFENNSEVVLETKLLDMPKDSPPEKVYFWLRINKVTHQCEKLDFVSMQKGDVKQERIFNQGILTFDSLIALFSSSSHLVALKPIDIDTISPNIKKIVSDFLELQSNP